MNLAMPSIRQENLQLIPADEKIRMVLHFKLVLISSMFGPNTVLAWCMLKQVGAGYYPRTLVMTKNFLQQDINGKLLKTKNLKRAYAIEKI